MGSQVSENFTCPRRVEDGTDRDDSPFTFAGSNRDHWDVRELGKNPRCSYCGSIDPNSFMLRIKAGDELGVTDKNYKAYLPGTDYPKFYFQHLSVEQRREFAAMMSRNEIVYGFPGHFTVLPFFVRLAPRG